MFLKMINFIVVDDNNIHRKKVNNIIISIMMNNKIGFEVEEFSDFDANLLNYFKNKNKNSKINFILP